MASTLLKVTDNLIRLTKGQDELLLANAFNLLPMYVRRGRDYVNTLVDYLRERPREITEILAEHPTDERLIDFLLKHKILIPNDASESASGRIDLPDTNEHKTDRLSAYLLLTQSCNFSCIYCLDGCETYKKNDNLQMPEKVAFRALDAFSARIKNDGRLEVVFFGGEPLLNWALAKKIIIYCETVIKEMHPSLNLHYHVTSNLSKLPSDFIKWALDYKITVLCDVDGNKELHDIHRPFKNGRSSFDKVRGHIKQLVDSGVPVSLRTTVTGLNQEHVLETTRLHKQMNGDSSAFVPVNLTNSDGNILADSLIPSLDQLLMSIQELYDSKEWELSKLFPFSSYRGHIAPCSRSVVGCGAPYGNTPVVDVHGNVYPCIYLVGMPAYQIGNIMQGTYCDNDSLQRLADKIHVDRTQGCRQCNWRYLCGGGCPVQKLISDGRENELTPKAREYCEKLNCDYTKKILTILLWDAAREADEQFRSATVAADSSAHCPNCALP